MEISHDIYRYVGLSMGNHTKSTYVKKCVGEITWPKHAFGRLKPNLKQTELQKSKNRGKKGWIRPENKKTENHERQRLATLKRLKRGDDNEFERNLRLEISRKVLKLAGDRRRQKSKTGE